MTPSGVTGVVVAEELRWFADLVIKKLATERSTAAALGLSVGTAIVASLTAEAGATTGGGEMMHPAGPPHPPAQPSQPSPPPSKKALPARDSVAARSDASSTDAAMSAVVDPTKNSPPPPVAAVPPAAAVGSLLSKKEEQRRKAAKVKVTVDAAFFFNFFRMLRIAMPRFRSKQGLHVIALSVLLLVRTALSLKIAQLAGELAQKMVEAKTRPFFHAVLRLALWSVPASLTNSGIRYVTALMQVAFRRNITQYFHSRYLSATAFFKCAGLGAVDQIDQRITEDVAKWADDAATLYSSIFKPLVDIVLFSHQVRRYGGWKAPGMIVLWYALVTVIMRSLAPPFAAMTNLQQRREGDFRTRHTHLLAYAEEVILSNGEDNQRRTLNGLFQLAIKQVNAISFTRAKHNIFDGLLVKYGSVMVGYAVCAVSNFSDAASKLNSAELTGLYLHTSRLLTDLARAIGQLILTYKTISGLAGYTHRITELEAQINAIHQRSSAAASRGGSEGQAEMVPSERIAFHNVPIVSPDGTTLVQALNFYVTPGMNLLIVGPNGCGKSSTFRLLGELWPAPGGRIEKPSYEHLYYVPQRPYMSSGTLRDQITYPDRYSDLPNVSEDKLYRCLQDAGLENILDRPGVSWSARLNWSGEALSHGEKQKLAMARLFFHQPRYAILDECSSAIDVDVEQKLYQRCYASGITLLTIAHRRSVWKYHNWILAFDGNGGYNFSPLQFTEDGSLRLTSVVNSSDPAMVGKELVLLPTGAIASTTL